MNSAGNTTVYALFPDGEQITEVRPAIDSPLSIERRNLGLTIAEAARVLGVPVATILKRESGDVSAREALDAIRRMNAFAARTSKRAAIQIEYSCTCRSWSRHASCRHVDAIGRMGRMHDPTRLQALLRKFAARRVSQANQ